MIALGVLVGVVMAQMVRQWLEMRANFRAAAQTYRAVIALVEQRRQP
jgi:hypothetical protein